TLVQGAKVIFLHNQLFSDGLYNGSIGIVLEILDDENIIVAFLLAQGISCTKVVKETVYFNIHENSPSNNSNSK
ncbi:11843_t:CDS:2, partial [Diversispora eburnea]